MKTTTTINPLSTSKVSSTYWNHIAGDIIVGGSSAVLEMALCFGTISSPGTVHHDFGLFSVVDDVMYYYLEAFIMAV